jgi:hypothetical protein
MLIFDWRRKVSKWLFLASLIFAVSVVQAKAQDRKSVSAAEVNGTFRSYFNGKFKGSYNEIKILSLGNGKLRVTFELVYPYIDGTGEQSANMGTADGTAAIDGDTAVYSSDEFGQCKITIKFLRPGTIKVTQSGMDSECGFGFNVKADSTYKKTSSAKPKFEQL